MTSFSFIHAADIHLDSPLSGLSAYEGAPVDLLRNAPRAAFSNLINEAIRERVDFMVIAGGLYDGAWRDFNTGLFFSGETGRLKREEIPVFIVHGNHDAESELTIGPDHLGQNFERRFRMPPRLPAPLETEKVSLHRFQVLKGPGRGFGECVPTVRQHIHNGLRCSRSVASGRPRPILPKPRMQFFTPDLRVRQAPAHKRSQNAPKR